MALSVDMTWQKADLWAELVKTVGESRIFDITLRSFPTLSMPFTAEIPAGF